jgi:hypothetical protein
MFTNNRRYSVVIASGRVLALKAENLRPVVNTLESTLTKETMNAVGTNDVRFPLSMTPGLESRKEQVLHPPIF